MKRLPENNITRSHIQKLIRETCTYKTKLKTIIEILTYLLAALGRIQQCRPIIHQNTIDMRRQHYINSQSTFLSNTTNLNTFSAPDFNTKCIFPYQFFFMRYVQRPPVGDTPTQLPSIPIPKSGPVKVKQKSCACPCVLKVKFFVLQLLLRSYVLTPDLEAGSPRAIPSTLSIKITLQFLVCFIILQDYRQTTRERDTDTLSCSAPRYATTVVVKKFLKRKKLINVKNSTLIKHL